LAQVRRLAARERGDRVHIASGGRCRPIIPLILNGSMDIFFFILLNAALFIRPAEVFPSFEVPLYVYLMIACLVLSGPRIVPGFGSLCQSPIAVCVIGLPIAGVLSHVSRGYFGLAVQWVDVLLRFLAYFLVLVVTVRSKARLRAFFGSLLGLTLVVTTLSVLHYLRIVYIPSLEAIEQKDVDPTTGMLYVIPRLCGTGIFNDPNDFSMILVLGILISIYFLDSQRHMLRFVWLGPMGFLLYALTLTYSRGGLLNLACSLLFLSLTRLGRRKTVIACTVALPLVLALALSGGRQARFDFGNSNDTSQGRIQNWVEGFILFRTAPLFGIGLDEYYQRLGFVAHNSYVEVYVEQGIFGGTLFSGAFYSAAFCVGYLFRRGAVVWDDEVALIGRYVLPLIGSYCVGMYSLSRAQSVLTYMILGIATAYVLVAAPYSTVAPVKFDARYFKRLCTFSFLWFAFLNLFCRLFVRWH
jgi:putative inorganic carbon (hco3(-)) transporter